MERKDELGYIAGGHPAGERVVRDEVGLFRRKDGIPAKPSEVLYAYFISLCNRMNLNNGQKGYEKFTADTTYFMLALKLFNTKFKYIHDMDENRAADGKELRYWFASIGSAFNEYEVLDEPTVNVLEVLVSFAERIDRDIMRGIDDPDRSIKWFWMMLNNLGIGDFTDDKWTVETDLYVGNVLDTWMNREFKANGKGGLFPLKKTENDQRIVEFWYQMQEYMQENFMDNF